MYSGKLIFSQVMDFMPIHTFRRCVARYQGDRNTRSFTCLDHYLCMAFAQLTYRESLRDIEACLRAQQQKLYHMGIRGTVAKSNLADANEQRAWHIYADLAHALIITARTLYRNEPFGIDLQQTVYALDATTIDLCLSMFPWAPFRQTKAAIKLHTLLDLRGNIPTFIHISDGTVHDVNVLDALPIEPGAFYVMDRGYLDYCRLHVISLAAGFFVTRSKSNLRCRRIYSHQINRATGLRYDQTIMLTGLYSLKDYPNKLRRIKYYDVDTDKTLIFLTNNFSLPPLTIAQLYRCRWQVGASREGRITQSVEVRPRLRDSRPCSLEGAVEREQDGEALRQHSLKGGCATLQVVTHSERRRSLVTRNPVAETVDNVRRQQGIVVKSHIHYCSPAGYQRRHEAKGYAETGEVLGVRRRNLDEEASPITVRGKWWGWHQDGGSGGNTVELRAAKRAGREAPGPVDIPLYKVRQG